MRFNRFMELTPGGYGGGGGGGGYSFTNTEAATYVAAMSSAPDDTRKGLIDTLVGGLKTDSLWTRLNRLFLIAAHDAQAGRLNAISPAGTQLTENGSPSYVTDRGWTLDGSTQWLDGGQTWGALSGFSLDDASAGVWCNLQGAGTGDLPHISANQGTRTYIEANSTGATKSRVNDSTTLSVTGGAATRTGHRAFSRRTSTDRELYRDGASIGSDGTVSSSIATGSFYVGRVGASTFCADRFAVMWSGAGLTDTEQSNLHSHLSTYLTAIGAN